MEDKNRWYNFTFRITWPNNQEPRVWIDIFLADTLVRNAIELGQKKTPITLWRIHRRWPRDERGHEFSLDCYTTDEIASLIDNFFKNSKEHKMLHENNLLEEYHYNVDGENIEDITTDAWPSEAAGKTWLLNGKKAWPYYIKGCCEMFLHLIEVIKDDRDSGNDIGQIERFYQEIDKRLTEIWQGYGCHAFFHHLSAVFGHKPLHLQGQFWGRF